MNIRILPTLIAKSIIVFIYKLSTIFFPINKNKVTFASYRSEQLSGNLLYIHNEIHDNYKDISVIVLLKKYRSSFQGKFDYLFHMIKASYHLATSRYFIIDDYYFPVYVIKVRKGTDIVQLWHAAGAFKKFGYSTVDHAFGPSKTYLEHIKVHSNYSMVFVSSREVIPYYSEAFNMSDEKIFPLGIPRTDFFFQQSMHVELKQNFYRKFPDLQGKKLILYAPTFRGKSHHQEPFDFPVDIKIMRERLGEEYRLLINLHPYMRTDLKIDSRDKDFVYHIKGQYDINELMVISDYLITDYSSVIFEYSLLKKPMAFLSNDLESYLKERDFYYEFLSFIPGPYFTTTENLCAWINEGHFDREKIEHFQHRFFDYIDGKASKRIVDFLLQNK